MPLWLIIAVTAAYTAFLFFMAWSGDKNPKPSRIGYALALAVYCTSWTYYGAVGTAVESGFDYIWILLGPAFVFLFASGFIRRIGDIASRENVSSLSSFLSTRYGKSQGVAVLATVAAICGSLPYIALQLKSVGLSLTALSGSGAAGPISANETVFFTALAMAVFAIMFGARQSDVTQRNHGLMRVLSFEAVFKLGALIAIAILSWAAMQETAPQIMARATAHFGAYELSGRAVTILLLSMGAIICLPRQFHVAIIERRDPADVDWARWVFPAYLILTSLVVVPITLVGLSLLPATASPDLFVIEIPLQQGERLLALLVFLGGFSAATGMVIVSTIALSTMVTNDIIVPLLLKNKNTATKQGQQIGGAQGSRLILIRRGVIIGLLLLAYGYFRVAENSAALAQIGLLSFAAAIQFAPALLGGVYWRQGKRNGVLFGLSAGLLIWIYTLFLPAIFGYQTMADSVPQLLNPSRLFGFDFGDSLTHGVIWSLSLNSLGYVLGSLFSSERLRDRVQAVAFTAKDGAKITRSLPAAGAITTISKEGLQALASRFLAAEAVDYSFAEFEKDNPSLEGPSEVADWRLVQHTERLLTRAIGASSARVIMSSAIGGVDVMLDDVLTIFDQKSHADKFDQHMLQSTLENVAQGISVVDSEQRLVAWNGAYTDLFNYPSDLVKVGTPIQALIEHNIATGWISPSNNSDQARRRVNHMRSGKAHRYERQNPDGRYIRIVGNPMSGGGYVTTFTDITEDKHRETALLEANETLEARVANRTKTLKTLTQELEAARQEAVGANASKTRFLAAASHDLLQPLNAARLFLGAVDGEESEKALLDKADRSIQSADELLKGLLNISRLDHSDVKPLWSDIPLGPLFEDLVEEATPMARKAGLEIRFVPTRLSVTADADFLQSIVRNFLSNARRYTQSGGILLGARRDGSDVRIEIWDTGPGIPTSQQALIFEEFQRCDDVDNLGIRGAGLGLSVVRRMANLMNARIGLKSVEGRGSVFSVTLQRAAKGEPKDIVQAVAKKSGVSEALSGLTVLCLDDEPVILEAMQALLSRWDCRVLLSASGEDALNKVAETDVDVVIADFQLGTPETGLDIIANLRSFLTSPSNVCLLTAQRSPEIDQRAARDEIQILSKPVNPEDIRMFLLSCMT